MAFSGDDITRNCIGLNWCMDAKYVWCVTLIVLLTETKLHVVDGTIYIYLSAVFKK